MRKTIAANKKSEAKKGTKNPMFGKTPWNKGLKGFLEGEKNPAWRGGRRINYAGYVQIYSPDHPYADKRRKLIFEHRLVMEQFLGRYLNPKEIVHHINGIKDDNKIENLVLLKNQSEHRKEHPEISKMGHDAFLKKKKVTKCLECGIETIMLSPATKYCIIHNRKTKDYIYER